MAKRGPKPKGAVKIEWSADFAYAIGLIASDGCLYDDGRHVSLVSKDLDQINNFLKCLGIESRIGITMSGYKNVRAYRIQFSDATFHSFLCSIGVKPKKSKTICEVSVPQPYFFDFLRGCFDGDGSFYSYWDPRWKSSHLFYLEFCSASEKYITWLRNCLYMQLSVRGHISRSKNSSTLQLRYAKSESLEIIGRMYYNRDVVCLARKSLKIAAALEIEGRVPASSIRVAPR